MARVVCCIALAALLCGCSTSGGLFGGHGKASSTTVSAPVDGVQRRGGDNIDVYLQTLHDLIEGDPVAQADAFRRAADAVNSAPTRPIVCGSRSRSRRRAIRRATRSRRRSN